ncbi:phage replication initiation protein, NGO0469 family [Paraburkholderia lycopersici]|uniref:Uncharacterized protein n=1 Tax=Paraburkholderia lycopersici TaxID=416944 RepID=A0A1G6GVE3_9BURK|nr:hypothetical protein [Paraburkholderia lycopersici]SDB85959.1 hypothetical protein SAMN05421548_101379 [Paraburkholderia lycopersici]
MKLSMPQFACSVRREVPSAGVHLARCTGMWDIGTQKGFFEGGHTVARRLILSFEVADQFHSRWGTPLGIWWRYTASLHGKSRLRRHIEGWLDCNLEEQHLESFELPSLLGKPCQLVIGHAPNTVNPRATVEQILPVPANVTLPDAMNDPSYFSLDSPNMEMFDSLPQAIRTMISASPEWQEIKQGQPANDLTADSVAA